MQTLEAIDLSGRHEGNRVTLRLGDTTVIHGRLDGVNHNKGFVSLQININGSQWHGTSGITVGEHVEVEVHSS